jgi:hypothetical protein
LGLTHVPDTDPFFIIVRVFEQMFPRIWIEALHLPRVPGTVHGPINADRFTNHAIVAVPGVSADETIQQASQQPQQAKRVHDNGSVRTKLTKLNDA